MKHIVHVVMSLATGGIENMVIDIANIQSTAHQVTLFVVNNIIDEKVKKRLKPEVRFISLQRTPGGRSLWPFIRLYHSFITLKPDIVHIHQRDALKLFPYPLFKHWFNIIHTIHTTGVSYGRELYNANTLCAISGTVQKDLLSRYQVKSRVIYNGVDSHSIPRKTHYQTSELIKIVQIGRLRHEEKGQDILIKALGYLHKQEPKLKFHLDFIGDGGSRQYLSQLIYQQQLEDFISFKGVLSRDVIYQSLPQWDLLIQPSRYEGFGLTVAEAMAAGLPVIVADQQGPMEIIQQGHYGYYFDSDNHQQLANTLLDVIKLYQSGDIVSKAQAAQAHVKKHFSIDHTAHYYAALH